MRSSPPTRCTPSESTPATWPGAARTTVIVKRNQPSLHAQLAALPWRDVPVAYDKRERGHGRTERRTLKVTAVARGLAFPHAAQAIRIIRRRTVKGKWSRETCYAVTSLTVTQASPARLAAIIRGHWGIEDRLHWVRDRTSTKTAPRSAPPRPAGHGQPAQPGHHHPAAGGRHQHRRRPALPRPTACPATPDDHEVLTDFAVALGGAARDRNGRGHRYGGAR